MNTSNLHRCCPRLGEWLVQRRLIDRHTLFSALSVSYRHNCRLGDALVWLGVLTRNAVEQEVKRRTGSCSPTLTNSDQKPHHQRVQSSRR